MHTPVFIDGIKRINFMSGIIRMELFYKKPTEYDEENTESAGELIMSPDGFVAVLDAVQHTADMLVEKGILKKENESKTSEGEK